MKKLLPLMLAFAMLLCGCTGSAKPKSETADVKVFCPVSAEHRHEEGLIAPRTVTVPDSGSGVETALSALESAPEDEKLLSPLPAGIRILSAELERGDLAVSLSEGFMSLTGMERTVLCACIADTMCALTEVSSVSVICGDRTFCSRLTPGGLMTANTVVSPSTVGCRLYFPKAADGSMGFEYRTIVLSENDYADRSILDELLKGPADASLTSAIPADTVLLSVFTENGVCTVSLSSAFLGSDNTTREAAQGAVYSIVDSLTSIRSISSVQILIDGRMTASVCGVDISKPLSASWTLTELEDTEISGVQT